MEADTDREQRESGATLTVVFTQVGNGKQKKVVEAVTDYGHDDKTLWFEHEHGPATRFNDVIEIESVYRGEDPVHVNKIEKECE